MIKDPIQVGFQQGGQAVPNITYKWWGFEETFHNGAYCSKRLVMNDQGYTSMHIHIEKHETLYVAQGTLTLEYIDQKEYKTTQLVQGSAFVVPPGLPHKLKALSGKIIIVESSTYDSAEDSIRIHD